MTPLAVHHLERVGRWQAQDGAADAGGRPVTKRAVLPDLIIVPPPALDQIPGLRQRVEELAVERRITQLTVG
jgi:hypothetical protein